MMAHAVPSLLQHVRRFARTSSSDEQLLAEYQSRRSEEAFSALIGRHGPMVLNVCRRILHDGHAAEDVFQATFLVLANRASSIRRQAALAGFLHGVAYRLAVRARRRRLSSLPETVCDQTASPPERLAWKEMLGILDQQLSQLSDRCRAPLVLCYLEGRTQDEAARQLGWSLNTLRRRLAEGRHLLEARLRGKGVTLQAALAGVLLGGTVAVPGSLRAATLGTALATDAGTAGVSALSLVKKTWPLIFTTAGKKSLAVVTLVVLSAAIGFGCWTVFAVPVPEVATSTVRVLAAGLADAATSDDPLSERGAVRLGTTRYRHGTRIACLAVSADGRLAAVASGNGSHAPARVFDLANGRCLYSLPTRFDNDTEGVALSPDGKILVTKDSKRIYFRDATTGNELRHFSYLSDSGGSRAVTDWLTFSPDGKHLAATLLGEAVQLIDVETGKVARTFPPGGAVSACVFSRDGKLLATAGYEKEKDGYVARLWEVGTGKELRIFAAGMFPAGNGQKRSLAFSPDGTLLASGGWGDARLRLWETGTGKEPTSFPRNEEELQSIAFSPDGKTIAAAADRIYLYDPHTGKEKLRIDRRVGKLAYNRDGSILIGAVSGALYQWDAASGRQLTPSVAQDSGVEQLLVRPDGQRLFTTDQEGDLHVWDPTGRKPPRRIAGGIDDKVVASPDGRFLAWTVSGPRDGCRIRLYALDSDRIIDRFPVFPEIASVEAFLPDGKTLLTVDRSAAMVRLWDIDTGKERRSFSAHPTRELRRSGSHRPSSSRRVALSPDGKTLVLADMDRNLPVGLWDLATGKVGHQLEVRLTSVHAAADGVSEVWRRWRNLKGYLQSGNGVTYSPDGRFLVTWSENPFASSTTDHVTVWDVANGHAIVDLQSERAGGAVCAAFAPDGRTLATASANGLIRLWEVATWKVRTEFRGHSDRITAMTFGPNGRLYTGALDTTVLGWDVRPPLSAIKGTLAESWNALRELDGKAGFMAQGRFLAEPDKAVEWFRTRLLHDKHPDTARVKALIADIDHDDFATRERAASSLKEHWPVTETALREVVARSTSTEARRRAEGILRVIEKEAHYRAVRTVEVLEWMATKEAHALLHALAKGTPDVRMAREASFACKRHEKRK